jgi:tripartite-type tricarboxylate transporter receptor subunit TctC
MSTSAFDTITRRRALALGLMVSALASVCATGAATAADTYPSRYIHLILPFPPGGGTDAVSRILGKKMTDDLGQSIVIDNRPGAAGNLATAIVAKAANDGYTLLVGFNGTLTVNPSLYPDSSVDIMRDLKPISLLAEGSYVLVTNPKLPVRSIKELIDYGKAHPGTLNYASAGVGSPLHMAGALFTSRTGIDAVHIPYKGGGPAVMAVLAGDAHFYFGSIASTLPNIEAGMLRPLAVASLKRSPLLPDMPTLDESGLPGFNVTSWYGLLAPAGVPDNVVATLQKELTKALADSEVIKTLDREGLNAVPSTSAEMAERIKTETAGWKKVIQDAHIKAQ